MARDGPNAVGGHKPLPSVDLVLLSRDIRALRARYAGAAAVAFVAACAALAMLAGPDLWTRWTLWQAPSPSAAEGTWPSEGPEAPRVEAAPAVVEAAAPPEPEPSAAPSAPTAPAAPTPANATQDGRRVVPFGAATGFRDALRRAGCSPQEAEQLVDALAGVVDFRRCRPEHELAFERDSDGTLTSFEYRVSVIESFVARRAGLDGFRAKRVLVPIERRRVAKGSEVWGSLARTLDGVGLGRVLAGAFVEAFEGTIDFSRGMRPGDSVRLIVDEEYAEGEFFRYGAVQALEYVGARTGRSRAFWFQQKGSSKGDFHDTRGRAIHGGWLRTPLRYDRISSGFDMHRLHPVLKRIMPHEGIDYSAAPGTPVWAAADGVVTFAGERGANGNLVAITHAGGYESFYAHLLRIARGVKPGVRVAQRDPIGAVGSTGRSTGPHLHFALKRGGRFLDPKRELNGPGRPLPAASMPRFRTLVRQLEKDLDAIPLAAAPHAETTAAAAVEDEPEAFHEEALDL